MNWHSLNWIDYTIISIVIVSTLISLIRGFVREALSLAAWILAFWVAFTFYSQLATVLKPYISSVPLRTGVAFFILLIATLIAGALINYLISSLTAKTGLSGIDRMLGIFFGFARGILVVGILLLLAKISDLPQTQAWKQSQFIPSFKPVGDWLMRLVPSDFQENISKPFLMPDDATPSSKPKQEDRPQPDLKKAAVTFTINPQEKV